MYPFFYLQIKDIIFQCVIYKVCTIVHFFKREKFINFISIKQVHNVYHI